jgi:hypothetical protein
MPSSALRQAFRASLDFALETATTLGRDHIGLPISQQFPLMTCESYATMEADSSVRVSTIHFRLLKRLS